MTNSRPVPSLDENLDVRRPGDLSALDLVPEATVLLDPAGRLVHCNERARTLLELTDSALGEELDEVLDVRDEAGQQLASEQLPSAPQGNPVADRLAERHVRVRLPSGTERLLAISGRLFEGGGHLLTFRHAGRRERLDINRSDLVATVSHEIRSPLTSVKGFTRTLLAKWDQFSDEQKHQMLATINEDADRVTRLLTELLDVARIDAGRVQLQRRMVDLEDILLRVVGKAEQHDERREFDVSVPEQIPELYADPDKIEQVVTNLVENAVRYAPESPIVLKVHDEPDNVRLAVCDEGPGIPADQLRSIFGKFARGRGNRRAGTGLGLFITKGLVEAHGGRVWAESEEGQGCRFVVTLPKGGIELGLEEG